MKRTGPGFWISPHQRSRMSNSMPICQLFLSLTKTATRRVNVQRLMFRADLSWLFSFFQLLRNGGLTWLSNYSSLICLHGPMLVAVFAFRDPAQDSFSLLEIKRTRVCTFEFLSLCPFLFYFLLILYFLYWLLIFFSLLVLLWDRSKISIHFPLSLFAWSIQLSAIIS